MASQIRIRTWAKELLEVEKELKPLKVKRDVLRDQLTNQMKIGDTMKVGSRTLIRVQSKSPIFKSLVRLKTLLKKDFIDVVTLSISQLRGVKGDEWVEDYCDDYSKRDYVMWEKEGR